MESMPPTALPTSLAVRRNSTWLTGRLRWPIAFLMALLLSAVATTTFAADPSAPTAEEMLAEMLADMESGSVTASTGSATAAVVTSDEGVTTAAGASTAESSAGTCGVGSGPRCCPWVPQDCTEKVAATAAVVDVDGNAGAAAVSPGSGAAIAGEPPDAATPVNPEGLGDPLKGVESGAVAIAGDGGALALAESINTTRSNIKSSTAVAVAGDPGLTDGSTLCPPTCPTGDEPAGIIVCNPQGVCFEFTTLPSMEVCIERLNEDGTGSGVFRCFGGTAAFGGGPGDPLSGGKGAVAVAGEGGAIAFTVVNTTRSNIKTSTAVAVAGDD